MTADDLMILVTCYTEACDDLGAGLFEQTEDETQTKHAKAKELHGKILAEVYRLHAELAEKKRQFMRLAEVNDQLQADLNRQANVTEKAIQALNRNADMGESAEAEATGLRAALNKIAERTGSDDPCRALVQIARDALAAKMALRGFRCQDCIGTREHGCYCEAMGAVQPGGPGA